MKNRMAPGRLICRHCNQSFDEESILRLWHGTGYSKAVRTNYNYPAADSKLGLPVLGGQMDAKVLDAGFHASYDVDPFAEYMADEDAFDDLPDYDWDRSEQEEKAAEAEVAAAEKGGPIAVISGIVGLACLMVSLIPVVGLVSVVPALAGMASGRYAWNSLKPGTAYYAAAVFGTIACAIAVVVALFNVLCGDQVMAFLKSAFPSLFTTS